METNHFESEHIGKLSIDYRLGISSANQFIPGPASVAGVLPLFQWAPHHLRLEEMGQPSTVGRGVAESASTDAPCQVGTYSQ